MIQGGDWMNYKFDADKKNFCLIKARKWTVQKKYQEKKYEKRKFPKVYWPFIHILWNISKLIFTIT